MSGSNPWDRNEGKFDVPSSSAVTGRFVGSGSKRRFEPSSEALRDFGAAYDDPRRYHGVEPVFVPVFVGERMHSEADRTPTPPKRGKRLR